jgi:phage tail tube protein FII
MANQAIFSLEQEAAMKAGMRLPVQETGATTRATSATYALMGGLEVEHRDTDAVHTMVVGKLYVVDISAWSNSGNGRVWTLPTSANVGERIGIMLEVGDDTEHLAITAATSDFLNGVDGGTEWSRLFITNECVIMRCVTADSKWIVEYDGRIPCQASLSHSSAQTIPNNQNDPVEHNTEDYDVGDIATIGSSGVSGKFTIRRAGKYIISLHSPISGGTTQFVSDDLVQTFLYKNGAANRVWQHRVSLTSSGTFGQEARSYTDNASATNYYEHYVKQDSGGNNNLQSSGTFKTYFKISEIL